MIRRFLVWLCDLGIAVIARTYRGSMARAAEQHANSAPKKEQR